MNDFKRDHGRYIVIKLKDLDDNQLDDIRGALIGVRTRECVVVEPHHPHYEETWENVQRCVEGQPSIGQERDALAAHVAALVEWADSYVGTTGLYEAVEAAREANTTSLARLKAEWQAEALEKLGNHFMVGASHKGFILRKAAELRRQAEEDA